MCLFVKFGHSCYKPHVNPMAWIAWKVVLKTKSSDLFLAPVRDWAYEAGTLQPQVRLEKQNSMKNRGYHGFITKAAANNFTTMHKEITVPVLIPAGSEVFYGTSREFVANQLIVFRDMQQLEQYLKNGGHL